MNSRYDQLNSVNKSVKNISRIIKFSLLDACPYQETDMFYVTFHNTDRFPIDVFWENQEGNEELIKSRLRPDNEMTVETSFTHLWKFRRSDSKEYLKASGNGFMSQVFEGCRFQAKSNERFLVTISYVAPPPTDSTNWITSPVMPPLTDQTEKITANSPSLPNTITSLDHSNAITMISSTDSTALTMTTEKSSKITPTVDENLSGNSS